MFCFTTRMIVHLSCLISDRKNPRESFFFKGLDYCVPGDIGPGPPMSPMGPPMPMGGPPIGGPMGGRMWSILGLRMDVC